MTSQTQTGQLNSFRAGNHELPFIIQGKEFKWHKQYISGAELKQLAGLPVNAELYLSVVEPWKDELITNETQVDLARPGIEQFYIREPLPYFIGEKEFQSNRQYIRGSQIRQEGHIPADFEIFLTIKGPWEDEKIEDNDWVDLARPGIEHFYSCKPNTNNG